MSPKLQKIEAELSKAYAKKAELEARIQELEARKTKTENTEIVDAFRTYELSLEDLKILTDMKKKGVNPVLAGALEHKEENDD